MRKMTNTYSVQSFIRTLAWFVSFLILGIFLLAIGAFSQRMLGEFWLLGAPMLIFNVVASSTIARVFFILPEWEKLVLLRLGKFYSVKDAGFFIIPPFIYSVAAIVDTRIETREVEATNTLTKDNVPIKITAAVEFRVEDPRKSVIDVLNYRQSVIWLATEALKNTIGSMDLKDLLSERDQIAMSLREQIDKGASVYGIDVRAVRVTDVGTPPSLIEELAVIARAKRASEAKKIQAEAEVIVADRLSEASRILSASAGSIRLRELQILNEISKEESSMVIIYPFGDKEGKAIANATAGSRQRAAAKSHPLS